MKGEVREKVVYYDFSEREVPSLLEKFRSEGKIVISWEKVIVGGFAALCFYFG